MESLAFEDRWSRWTNTVTSLERTLNPVVKREVDINTPDWKEQLDNSPHPADETGTREELACLFNDFVDVFPALSHDQRLQLIDFLYENESVMYSAVINADPRTEDGFRHHIILYILDDQGRDTRDAILALDALRRTGEKAGLNVTRIFRELAEMASDRDKFGWGSTRHLLLR